jgi:hypothetical protein
MSSSTESSNQVQGAKQGPQQAEATQLNKVSPDPSISAILASLPSQSFIISIDI